MLTDGCSLNNGFSKALSITDYDADPLRVASRQFEIGSTRTGISVLAERNLTNADGTTRREIDVQYAINYLDGTKNEVATQTLITGSSAGATMADGTACATPENKADLRFFGNRRIANAFVNASNQRLERTFLATGLAVNPAVVYDKYITLGVRDPAKVATYATITGPGLIYTGITNNATFKMLSPRLLRDAPELAGKNGNFVDWKDTDSFRICRDPAGFFASADTVDCVTNGVSGNSWGRFSFADPAALDTSFDAFGVIKGGAYTVKLYNDDGWKTVNGQLGVWAAERFPIRLNAGRASR